MQGDIVAQGVELILYGMSTVVLFLALLVVAIMIMSRVVTRYFPEQESSAAAALQKLRGQKRSASQPQPADDPNLVAVIGAAIHQHRVNKK
ncbi:MAG: oxaloacetate decarboxylase [Gammaproteobacteria bacterium]|nr:MAG: oxaloacetate decarboxylase [Gammaproteobacteria bacterium]RLA57669.1 MAG: oxaloacetate decarboxylase [Gammaproteobacteria bacterium]HDY82564.1 oxaloacetate decarboxylase [Halieaceae bacterium]